MHTKAKILYLIIQITISICLHSIRTSMFMAVGRLIAPSIHYLNESHIFKSLDHMVHLRETVGNATPLFHVSTNQTYQQKQFPSMTHYLAAMKLWRKLFLGPLPDPNPPTGRDSSLVRLLKRKQKHIKIGDNVV